ncbi:site-specific integrase [Vibrio sp. H11]|uniref:tyrosine-type recombinase/integrase n=1 Tax=Vibrio sp. H11 TaxID=2565928 RepID=UPI0010A5C166|nr:site-specific integrase [Vibrio sp. H11]
MATEQRKLSDKEIQRCLSDSRITAIRGIGEPFELRIHANRQTGSWYLIQHRGNKTRRSKLANWPTLTTKQLLSQKNELIGNVTLGKTATLDDWDSVEQLLSWYLVRALSDRSLSRKRKADIKSSITRHLIPCLGQERLQDVSESLLDNELIWPLQNRYELGTVRQHFALLKRIFKQATKLKHLAVNPMASMVFSDFIDAEIKPKASRLQQKDIIPLWQKISQAHAVKKVLVVLMLAHGTRIGETRQLRWDHIDIERQRLDIPADITKTGEALTVPLTDWAMTWLEHLKFHQSLRGYQGKYLFPTAKGRKPISESTANEWVKSISEGDWSAHDLRKLARSCWADLGVDYMVAERLLNHALSRLDQAYIHTYVEQQKREALTRWHDLLVDKKQALRTDTIPTQHELNEPAEALR